MNSRGQILAFALLPLVGLAAGWADELQPGGAASRGALESIRASADGKRFVRGAAGEEFVVWGVNYDHDDGGRLLEDYWEDEWETVVGDFQEMKSLGANCVRIHLQFEKFVDDSRQPIPAACDRLGKLVRLAETTGLYLDVTGLGCYHKRNVPKWYDALSEKDRWAAQVVFWEAVAKSCAGSAAIFCYDLMNEPILPGKEPAKEWLAGEFGGKNFVQRVTLDLTGRTREEVAEAWVNRMVEAIRKHDERSMITVGVIPWVFVFGGGEPLFHGSRAGKRLDFVSVHFYPEAGKVDKAITGLRAYELGKPLVIEEIFPLKCSMDELGDFVNKSAGFADGWISFYWGKSAEELRAKENASIGDAITASWLEKFQELSRERERKGRK